ncbi:MAG TPA: selenocysteine-specific translation elongation factor [Candidatus Acidoferrales bacterium]|nr:selenocysteine-specific translation elongation factor [Candidatus Acidoferrales bacterium]
MHIIGTAGHIDHGKSSLVLALTGHNPDRLIEERERGMTLDLGFAPLRFADGVEAGIIDVPGHERFLHNMLAGAAGMELLLLVIAAPDGPRRQTFEHLQILSCLNVARVLVVLTKTDLVAEADRPTAVELARAACEGTVAANAPVVFVSTVTSEGIAELKTRIHDALAELPARRTSAPAYLPVDRVFALPGHGTIVTGTLMQGTISAGDTLALQPSGLVARVKSLQVFGAKAQTVTGGSRVAANLPGIEVGQIARGEALVAAREFRPVRELDVEFTPFADAMAMLRKRVPARVHVGSAEIPGQLRFDDGIPAAGRPARARLLLWRAAVVYPGMRLIVRRMSPKDLLGGARVLAQGARDASLPSSGDPAFDEAPESAREISILLEESGLVALDGMALSARANVKLATAEAALVWLGDHGHAVRLNKPAAYVSHTADDAAFARARGFLERRHADVPWRLGASLAEIATQLGAAEPLVSRLLAHWHDDGRVAVRAGVWHLPGHEPALTAEQTRFFESLLAQDERAPSVPRAWTEVTKAVASAGTATGEAFESLLAVGALVRVGEDLYPRAQFDRARLTVKTLLEREGQATMAQIRDALGTSRKHALPLMEHFDSSGLTIRVGDLRRLRRA